VRRPPVARTMGRDACEVKWQRLFGMESMLEMCLASWQARVAEWFQWEADLSV
jgi:hypothetical protein